MLCAALLSPLGVAADLQISQIADRAPDLAVFVNSSGLPPAARSGAQGTALSAALGSTPLKVKSSVPWEASQGITLVVALDVSASLRPADFNAIKQALASVLASLPSDSRVALLSIGTDVATVMPFAKPTEIVGAPLDGLAPDARQTALYEALLTSQQLASTAAAELPLRRVVLVLTDGVDDSPRGFSADEALKKISSGDAPVFALALAPPRPNATQRAAIRALSLKAGEEERGDPRARAYRAGARRRLRAVDRAVGRRVAEGAARAGDAGATRDARLHGVRA